MDSNKFTLVMGQYRYGDKACGCKELKTLLGYKENDYVVCPFANSNYSVRFAEHICRFYIKRKVEIYKVIVNNTDIVLKEFSTENDDHAYSEAKEFITTIRDGIVHIECEEINGN